MHFYGPRTAGDLEGVMLLIHVVLVRPFLSPNFSAFTHEPAKAQRRSGVIAGASSSELTAEHGRTPVLRLPDSRPFPNSTQRSLLCSSIDLLGFDTFSAEGHMFAKRRSLYLLLKLAPSCRRNKGLSRSLTHVSLCCGQACMPCSSHPITQ